jgi:hypothetical protein
MITQRTIELSLLNSMTKYPSIPTYHTMDRGVLGEVAVRFDGPIYLTEKIDGTNARIILLPEGTYLLGSREELVYASGDLIGNPQLGIAEHLRPIADAITSYDAEPGITVIYGELYGGKVTAASKQYTSSQAVGFRVFDVATISGYKAAELLEYEPRSIALWRDIGGQPFLSARDLEHYARAFDLDLVPQCATCAILPASHADTLTWLNKLIPATWAGMDAHGRPEGIVARSADRRQIAKLRVEDYEKTLRRR